MNAIAFTQTIIDIITITDPNEQEDAIEEFIDQIEDYGVWRYEEGYSAGFYDGEVSRL